MFKIAKILLLGLLTLSLSGCPFSRSGPVSMGLDTYMSSKGAGPYATASELQANLYREGNKFCESQGKVLQPISEQGVDGMPLVRNSTAQIKFRCLKKDDPEISRPTMKPIADVIIENNIQVKKETKEIPSQQTGDMYVELKKLKELLDADIITQAEFNTKKTRILAK